MRRFGRFPCAPILAAFLFVTVATWSRAASADTGYRLPWRAGQQVYVTQDCNDSCCNDHVGHNEYAWDFATYTPFEVVAPRAGTVVHVKMSSDRGGDSNEVDAANYLVIDHGDGTASILLHLARGSLDPAVRCGSFVRQGQRLAVTGATGWASGNHLHFQVNRIPPSMNRTCECGPDGMACGAYESHWDLFWSRDTASASVPIDFDDWHGASRCADRHDDLLLTSQNVDTRDPIVPVDPGQPRRFVPIRGQWAAAQGGMHGRYFAASSGAEAAALVPLDGVVPSPGVYEVWTALPAQRRSTGAAVARAEVIARGERTSQMQQQAVAGGGYRPLRGTFKFTGRAGEGVLLSAFARPAESLAVDGVLLRRVADVGHASAGQACTRSADCAGDLVCGENVCRAGCETASCGAGQVCDPTGLCIARASSSSAPSETALARDWQPTARPAGDAGAASVATSLSGMVEPITPPTIVPRASRGEAARAERNTSRRALPGTSRQHVQHVPRALPWFGVIAFGGLALWSRRKK